MPITAFNTGASFVVGTTGCVSMRTPKKHVYHVLLKGYPEGTCLYWCVVVSLALLTRPTVRPSQATVI